MKKSVLQQFVWATILPLILIVSFYLSWLILSNQNFFYEFWYDNTKLEEFINLYSPQNLHKPEFSLTNREERIRVFSETLVSVNNRGANLDKIQFNSPEGKLLGLLYHKAEVEHLRLVSNLISFLKIISILSISLLIVLLGIVYRVRLMIPSIRKIIISYSVILILIGFVVSVIGPASVFIFLHELVFPVGHQWFFYYQDSLMTTLMMAPELFAYFSGIWIALSIAVDAFLTLFLFKTLGKWLVSNNSE